MQQRISKFNRILKIREDSRRNEQAILAAERSEERAVINHITQLEDEKAQAIRDFSKPGEKMISATDLWFQRQFIDAIDMDIHKGQESLNEVRGARLVERHKDVKIMETYIDHLKELNFQEELNIEQNELDDVATMQFSRKGDY